MATVKQQRPPCFLDLFCGIGGLSIGLQKSGMSPVGGIDNWAEARATFERNHPGVKFLLADIETIGLNRIEGEFATEAGAIDVVVGGPPCQGFSTVGKRDRGDPRNQLWRSFFDLVKEIRPAYVVIENVEGPSATASSRTSTASATG